MAELLCRDGTLPIDARNNQGRTALHLALANNKTRLGDFLLRRGADPNALDHEGRTPLHAMFEKFNRVEIMRMFFKVNDEMQREVLIDVQDDKGVTPLQVALTKNFQAAVKLLLKRGADPNVANEKGLTPLHIICQGKPITYEGSTDVEPYKGDKFFRLIYGSRHHIVRTVDAQDESGNTPLHYAVKISGDRVLIRLLLKSGGANLNATNAEGLTPVETIYGNHSQDGLVDMLYKMSCEFKQPLRMRLDAPYDGTRSLLQWAVASLRPKLVDVYLRSTSDPASFKFPSVQDFDELYVNTHVLQERMTREQERSPRLRKEFEHQKNAHRLAVILDATSIVRRLQHKGYELKRSDALTLMKVFHKLGFAFGDPVESFNQDKFTDSSKRIMIGKSVSLHDFMHLPLERTFKLVTFGQLAIAQKRVLKALADDDARDAVRRKMTSTLLRQFTRAWAWHSFPQPLPDLCLNMVFEHLSSKDFWSMTASAELREAAARDDARNRKRKRS
ncbi:serine/threonine-protein phosphatase 6 regulatory ankyrin repeat subunit A-like [Trichogramma pretiosum]|uniref:serine/threonine-protein phosphatase 6 regulatory ankyrin repeat subunit A-like n=1 Tax=Trichogramma pretiosum TaxID=7493 RepID=UPI000C719342|nr:serine/threonine-protein phosphatase 6 regulatory ankyrin repeat subunit A-like [Trichogramma pretiosum]